MRAGEYAFVAATGMGGTAAATSVVVFDFGDEGYELGQGRSCGTLVHVADNVFGTSPTGSLL